MPNSRDHSSARRFIFSHSWQIQRDEGNSANKSSNSPSLQGNSARVFTFEPTKSGWTGTIYNLGTNKGM